VLGDLPQGNGDPSLCVFNEHITPNHHKVAREFVLLDNTYCSGILSADGHQWADSAIATITWKIVRRVSPQLCPWPERERGGRAGLFARRFHLGQRHRAWQDVARLRRIRHHRDALADKSKKRKPAFLDYYRDFLNQAGAIEIGCRPAIESLRPYQATNTVGWALDIPDVFRAAQFIRELKQFEQTGDFPNLSIICLPNDHTSATKSGCPTPAAMAADNDLAFGQIFEAISRSRFWKETCIFAIEDDPQDGWDHVSGYRTTCLRRQPLHPPRRRRRRPIQPDQPPAHDGIDARPAPDEPDGRHRHAHDRVLH